MQLDKQSDFSSSAAASTAGEGTCVVPVSHYWYVNHMYNEEIKRIEKENGVNIKAEVNVVFEAGQKDGSPQKALSEFINLVQKCLGESHGSVIPLKSLDAEELKDTLKIIKRPENKLLLALSSQEMTVYGPRQSQDAISESLNATQKTPTDAYNFAGEFTWPTPHTSLGIGKNPLVDAGLTFEEGYWRLMTTSFGECIDKIKAKFGVHLKESGIGQGKVEVKAVHKSSGGNASMESHAVRALLRLYQKIATSPMNLPQQHGVSDSPKNLSNVYTSEGASSGPVPNGQSGHGTFKTDASTEEGATAGDDKDENCPICMDTFTKKKKLTCKHEFCAECLSRSIKSIGPICPVCKDVFGIVKGDQPDGRMSSYVSPSQIPGFQNCGTIIINYDIRAGNQTVNVNLNILGHCVDFVIWKLISNTVVNYVYDLLSFCRKSIQILESTIMVFKEQHIFQTTKRATKCCAC